MFIIKFIFKNIKDKKFRFFLIIFSISISCALFFASNSLSLTMKKIYLNMRRSWLGSSDIYISANRNSPSWLFRLNKALELNDKFEYIVGSIMEGGVMYKPSIDEIYGMSLFGINYDDLQKYNPIKIVTEKDLFPFEGRKIIFNTIFLDKYNLKVGDSINLFMGDNKYKFFISAAAEPDGIFRQFGESTTGIIPIERLQSIYKANGRISETFIKLKNKEEVMPVLNQLTKIYNRYEVRESISRNEMNRYTDQISTPFKIMTVFVLFMSIFIIYSSFKVITAERLPVIGTMRSIGATKKTTDIILILESIIYGIIGGIIGIILGFLILYIMTYIQSYNPWNRVRFNVQIDFSYIYLILSFILAILLSFIGSIVPIIRISKIPIKDIILNKVEVKYKEKSRRYIIGILLIIISIITPFFVPKKLALIIDMSCAIAIFIGINFIIPKLTSLLIKIFEKGYTLIFGNIGILSAKNLRENKSILNSISLLAIGISSILMISTINFSVDKELLDFYYHAKFDASLWFWRANRNVERVIRYVKGAKDTYGTYRTRNIEVKGFENKFERVYGVNRKYLDYWDFGIKEESMFELENGRNILATTTIKDRFQLKKGDVLTLITEKGERQYKVIDFFYSLMNNGDFILISDRYLKLDMGVEFYDTVYIKTYLDPDEFVKTIKKRFGRMRGSIMSVNEMQKNDYESNRQMFIILNGFSVLALIIGIFGILNNFVINFIQRRRHLAVFRSIGMSKKQIVLMVFLEALTGGLIGGIMGIVSGLLILQIVPFVLRAIEQSIPLHYSLFQFIMFMIMGMVITLIGSISPALKSSKLNIIESIKYE